MSAFSRRVVLVASLVAMAAAGPAASQWGERRRHRGRHGDHDCAMRALADGRAKPLSELLPDIEKTLGGQVIDVDLEHCAGRVVYEIKVLRPDGRLVETVVDALTGERLADHHQDANDRDDR